MARHVLASALGGPQLLGQGGGAGLAAWAWAPARWAARGGPATRAGPRGVGQPRALRERARDAGQLGRGGAQRPRSASRMRGGGGGEGVWAGVAERPRKGGTSHDWGK
jgi:hypothetical protein